MASASVRRRPWRETINANLQRETISKMAMCVQRRLCHSADPKDAHHTALIEVVDGAAAQMASFAASMAALPGPSAIVSVGPPLFCNGPSRGSALMPGQVVSG